MLRGIGLMAIAALTAGMALAAMPALLRAVTVPGDAVARKGVADQSSIVVTATVGSATVSGSRVSPGLARIALHAPDGALRGLAEALVQPWKMSFEAELQDGQGKPVAPRSGDVLEVVTPHDRTTFTIPELVLQFDRRQDVISGRTAPGSVVRLGLGVEDHRVDRVQATADGLFALSFDPEARVTGDTPLYVDVTTNAGHHLLSTRHVPFIRASLVPGDLSGAARPLADVAIELVAADGRRRGQSWTIAGPDGRFTTWARNAAGWRVRPAPGDRVSVRDGESELNLTVPPLTADWDLTANRLGGQGAPGAALELVVWNPWFPGESDEPTSVVGSTGLWSVNPAVAVHPGTHYYVTERLAEGDQAYYCVQVPLLHIQPGLAAVEIETLYDVFASLELWRAGQMVARADGGGLSVGTINLVLRDTHGQEVPAAPGDHIHALLDGHPQDIAVSVLTSSIDPATNRLVGQAPPGMAVRLAAPGPLPEIATADEDGGFGFDLGERAASGGPAPGVRFQAYYRTTLGHNIRSLFLGPSLSAEIFGRTVRGRATAHARVNVSRRRSGSPSMTTIEGQSDSAGELELRFDPSTPILAPGDAVIMTVGEVTTGLTLPVLTAEMADSGETLSGTGPANGLLDVRAYLGHSDEPEQLTAFISPAGTWSVNLRQRVNGLGSIDPRWVRAFELRYLESPNAARQTVPGPLAGPGRTLFLPSAVVGRQDGVSAHAARPIAQTVAEPTFSSSPNR